MTKIHQATPKYFMFWCPGCECAHAINEHWRFNGDLEKPTISPSILSNGDRRCPNTPRCHSFVRDGKIQFLSDCDHALAGQTVELPEWDLTQ
jgi:hypothetical protein